MKHFLARIALLLLVASTSLAQLITSQSSGTPTATGATITATTCAAAVGQISYGTDTSYGSLSAADSSGTSHSIALSGLSPSTAYHYQITLTDAGGNVLVSPDSTFTTAGTTPSVTTNPSNTTGCNGSLVTLVAHASGSPTPTVQWQKSTTSGGSTYANIAGATSDSYAFVPVAGDNGFNYRAVFTNAGGSATSTAATITVNTVPVITTSPQNQSVIAGATAVFSVVVSGTPNPTVQWQFSTGGAYADIAGATSTTLTLTGTTVIQNGRTYRAVVTNSCGTVNSSPATLTVTSSQTYSLSFSTSSARTSGAFLQGAALSGTRYVFTSLASSATTSNITGVSKVCYWLNDKLMTGSGSGCDMLSPFDFKSSTQLAAPVHAAVTGNNGAGGTFPLNIPATGSGNFLVVAVRSGACPSDPPADVTLTDNLGGTYLVATNQLVTVGGLRHRYKVMYRKAVPSGITTLTIGAPSCSTAIAREYSGVEGTLDVAASTIVGQQNVTSFTSGSIATNSNNLVLGVVGSPSVLTFSAGSGWTASSSTISSALPGSSFMEEKLNAVPGNYAATGTASVSGGLESVVTAFNTATGVAGWDTTKLANGTYTITQQVTPVSGNAEVYTATFTVSNAAPHSVDLAWVKGASTNPVTYSVGRHDGVCSGAFAGTTKVSGLPQTTPSWTDLGVVSGSTYCYAVLEVDTTNGIPSPYSNQVTAVIP